MRPAVAAPMLEPGGSFAPMLERVIPAVVTIRVTGRKLRPTPIPMRQKDGKAAAMPPPETEKFGAGGSGVIVDAEQGYIITNNHVIENATRIEVALSSGRRMLAKLIGTDIGSDVAVIKVDEPGLPSIKLGDSDAARVGDIVAAVGNPFGLEGTATLGIVSAVMRTEIGHGLFEDYLQIDAQIHPGNSGGALVNARGELIGINTVGGERRSLGIGFAVPFNMARVIMDELITAGRMRRGSTGIIAADLPMELASPRDGGVTRGAIVRKVLPKSPAAAAGVQVGDIVVSAGNRPVRSAAEFVTRTATVPLGTSIPIVLFAKGQGRLVSLMSADIVIDPEEITLPPEMGSLAGAVVAEILLGNRLYGDVLGAEVLRVAAGSPAYWIGLEPGDVIVGIDDAKVRSPKELVYRVGRAGTELRIAIVRGGAPGLIRGQH
ncbi:MAG: trypsin-like peptidase domain-containing protein [Hyphomicrobiaceae bacterium]